MDEKYCTSALLNTIIYLILTPRHLQVLIDSTYFILKYIYNKKTFKVTYNFVVVN